SFHAIRRKRFEESAAMSTGPKAEEASQSGSSRIEPSNPRPLRTGIRALIALVVASGAIFWAWRAVWESNHPLMAAAARLRAPDASQRLAAIQEVSELGNNSGGEAINALMPALSDRDAKVRSAAALALAGVGAVPAKAGTDTEAVREAGRGLLAALKD